MSEVQLEDDADGDYVVNEFDVYFSNEHADLLYLLQFVSKFQNNEFDNMSGTHDGEKDCIEAKMKKHSRIISLVAPFDKKDPNYSMEKVRDFVQIDYEANAKKDEKLDSTFGCQKMVSSMIPLSATQMCGKFVDNGFYMTPIDSALQFRLSFDHMDSKTSKHTTNEHMNQGDVNAEEASVLNIQYKKKETEEELITKFKSFLYNQKMASEESWVDFKWYGKFSKESIEISDSLFRAVDTCIRFSDVSKATYLNRICRFLKSGLDFASKGMLPDNNQKSNAEEERSDDYLFVNWVNSNYNIAALKEALVCLFARYDIVDYVSLVNKLRDLNKGPDLDNINDILDEINVMRLHQVAILKNIGEPAVDKYRTTVLLSFKNSISVKKSDVIETIRDRLGDVPSASLCTKILRGLGTAKGANWILKSGHHLV